MAARERRERAWAGATDGQAPPNRESRREWRAGMGRATRAIEQAEVVGPS